MATQAEAVADLQDMGPGGICSDCGHFAYRHHGMQCHFPPDDGEQPCTCEGMLWQGQRLQMDCRSGPILVGQ